jgi:hypothetical protein
VDVIATAGSAPTLPVPLIGGEPARGWCYYFQEASLAAQQGDWEKVAGIQGEIGQLGLHPNDQIEWMPFLLAQASLGNLQAMKEIGTRINTEKFYRQQACRNLTAMPEQGFACHESQAYADQLFCSGSSRTRITDHRFFHSQVLRRISSEVSFRSPGRAPPWSVPTASVRPCCAFSSGWKSRPPGR